MNLFLFTGSNLVYTVSNVFYPDNMAINHILLPVLVFEI